ncbi:putative kinesin motor domain superfamily [Helianthus annuus]|nr:putative kinesin motor domain superfamily [Helianthus annuus]
MDTGFKDGCQTWLISQAMNALFNKIESLQHQLEFQLRVSFIEVEYEVLNLLDPEHAQITVLMHYGLSFLESL